VLAVCGVAIVFWVFWNVYKLFTRPEELTRFQQLVSDCLETIVSSTEGQVKLVVPPQVLAYVIPLILLMIATSVGGILITAGIKLIYGQFRKPSGQSRS
jgi:hypothetical protein